MKIINIKYFQNHLQLYLWKSLILDYKKWCCEFCFKTQVSIWKTMDVCLFNPYFQSTLLCFTPRSDLINNVIWCRRMVDLPPLPSALTAVYRGKQYGSMRIIKIRFLTNKLITKTHYQTIRYSFWFLWKSKQNNIHI